MNSSQIFACVIFTIALILVPAGSSVRHHARAEPSDDNVNGGIGCGACTLVIGLIEQATAVNNVSVVDFVSRQLCTMFNGQYNMLCSFLVTIWGPAVVEKLTNNESPDVVCYSLGICHADPGVGYCHLFPVPEEGLAQAVQNSRNNARIIPTFPWSMTESESDICYLPGVGAICDIFKTTFGNHVPAVDLDRDKFSVVQSFRGSFWRGKDCDDVNEFIYPGRKPLFNDYIFDSNCNGIRGANPVTGIPYEKELCDGTDQYGLIYIGDSIGAHFHVPEQWLTASQITRDIFRNMSVVMSNQFDWPHVAFSTGYTSVDWPIMKGVSTKSLYQRLRQRNLCNHRDFQNICFNGAETNTMKPFLSSISRGREQDKPALVFYALMGNDVCRRFMNRTDQLTTPDEYRESVVESLTYLASILPNGSHIILVGLVNGSFIFPAMGHRLHPIGKLRGDVTYTNLFDWFNCMRIGPCFGWMNKDETYRNATTLRALELSNTLEDISRTLKLDGVELHFLENPMREVLKRFEAMGFETWQALEPIDSMHPVQELQPLISDVLWEGMETNFPHILGNVNPKNDLIRQIFGQQDGH